MTPHNIIPVFQALIGDWDWIGDYTIVPDARAQLFREKFRCRDQLTEAAGKYFALYHPSSSWKWLSVRLYRDGETEALQRAKRHIQTVKGNVDVLLCNMHVHVHVHIDC